MFSVQSLRFFLISVHITSAYYIYRRLECFLFSKSMLMYLNWIWGNKLSITFFFFITGFVILSDLTRRYYCHKFFMGQSYVCIYFLLTLLNCMECLGCLCNDNDTEKIMIQKIITFLKHSVCISIFSH